jgi:DNA-binding NarL/FixJ family response regulator
MEGERNYDPKCSTFQILFDLNHSIYLACSAMIRLSGSSSRQFRFEMLPRVATMLPCLIARGHVFLSSIGAGLTMQTIIVADDQELYQAGMVELLSRVENVQIKAQHRDWKSFLGALAVNCGALVIASTSYVCDVNRLVKEAGESRCPVLLVAEDSDSPHRYQATGVAAVVRRSTSPAALIETIRRTLPNNHSRLRSANAHIADRAGARALASLSSGEMTIVAMMMQGYKNRRIADNLGISEQAVRSRFQKIFDKTGLSTRLELALFISDHQALASAAAEAFSKMERVRPACWMELQRS